MSFGDLNKPIWEQILRENSPNEYFYKVTKSFMLEYKLDFEKVSSNKQYLENPTAFDIMSKFGDKEVSDPTPSLKTIVDEDVFTAAGYPDWYVASFPDVYLWATRDGLPIVKVLFSAYREADIIEDGKINLFFLNALVKNYLRHKSNRLECC